MMPSHDRCCEILAGLTLACVVVMAALWPLVLDGDGGAAAGFVIWATLAGLVVGQWIWFRWLAIKLGVIYSWGKRSRRVW